jgi:large subunit ribosomal protein L16
MLAPKKTKHRKWQTGRKSVARRSLPDTRGITVAFGSHGLKAMTPARITSNQIESARRALTRAAGKTAKVWVRIFPDRPFTRKTAKVWVRIFPDRPFTRKAAEVGMGSGKGDVAGYVCEVRPGRILFEIDGAPEAMAREALHKAGTKLPVTARVVARQ